MNYTSRKYRISREKCWFGIKVMYLGGSMKVEPAICFAKLWCHFRYRFGVQKWSITVEHPHNVSSFHITQGMVHKLLSAASSPDTTCLVQSRKSVVCTCRHRIVYTAEIHRETGSYYFTFLFLLCLLSCPNRRESEREMVLALGATYLPIICVYVCVVMHISEL